MDAKLKCEEHIVRAAAEGFEAVLGSRRRLKGLSAAIARRKLTSMIAPVVDYDSNIWMHGFKDTLILSTNRTQRMGAQGIVATSVAEVEACIANAYEVWIYEAFSEEHIADAKVQETTPFTALPDRRSAERHSDGRVGNHRSVHTGTMGEETGGCHRWQQAVEILRSARNDPRDEDPFFFTTPGKREEQNA